MREKYIIGNWKMYKTVQETVTFVRGLLEADLKQTVYIAVPFTAISEAAALAKKSNVVIGAQNMNDANVGAYTGEIAGVMLKSAGAEFVLIGHSERRLYFKESNEFINRKLLRALEDKLLPVLCIGETFEEKEMGQTEQVLRTQLEIGLANLDPSKKIVIAYEPVWAIGTGKTATPELANQIQEFIRNTIGELFSPEFGETTSILYGGSVNGGNAEALTKEPNIDGVLVGGASLSLESFIQIVQNSSLS
jgi:triosephosphate isomerase